MILRTYTRDLDFPLSTYLTRTDCDTLGTVAGFAEVVEKDRRFGCGGVLSVAIREGL